MADNDSVFAQGDHLDPDSIALVASGEAISVAEAQHIEHCDECAERVDLASTLLNVEPLPRSDGRSQRAIARLMDRLTAAGAVEPPEGRGASIVVALSPCRLAVVNTDTEVRIRRAVAVRSADASTDPPGVAFFRRLGDIEVEIHLIRSSSSTFHLVVGLVKDSPNDLNLKVGLHRGVRRLAIEPATFGSATFKNLSLGSYRLEIQDEQRSLGFVDVQVESRNDDQGGV